MLAAWLGTFASAADEPPDLPSSEIVKRGRDATAFVEAGPGRSASAFCVHPSGLFITNNHVIQGHASNIKLVVNSGTLEQKVLDAKLIRRDREADLALLSVEKADGLAALPLGVADKLTELMEVVLFGFPFGRGQMTGADQYPSISINRGTISSLKRKDRQLDRLQLQAAVNPGNSGGPLLDTKGRVIGVIVGRVEGHIGAGIDLAIPVNVLDRFLSRPAISFTPTTRGTVKMAEPLELSARVVSLIPVTSPLDVQVVFAAGTERERRVSMTLAGDVYHANAVPFPDSKEPVKVAVEVKFADGSVKGIVEDRSIGGPGAPDLKLSQLSNLRMSPKIEARTTNGTVLKGAAVALNELTVAIGGQALRLDLSKALEIDMPEAANTGAVSCTLVVRRGPDEVGRESMPIYLAGAQRPSFKALRDGEFIKPARSTTPVSYVLIESSPGDFIGQGKNYSYDADDLNFQRAVGVVHCQIGAFGNWTLALSAGLGKNLEVGEYRHAKRQPFAGESPGLEFFGNGRGNNTLTGEFRIWEYETKGNVVVRLAVDFVQRSEGKLAPLAGMLRYNSTFY